MAIVKSDEARAAACELWDISWDAPSLEDVRAFREAQELSEQERATREARAGKPGKNGPDYPTMQEMCDRMGSCYRWRVWEQRGVTSSNWTPMLNLLIEGWVDIDDLSHEDEPFETILVLQDAMGMHPSEFTGATMQTISAWRKRGVINGSQGSAALIRWMRATLDV